MKRVIFALGILFLFTTCKKEIPQKQLTVNVTPDVGGSVTPSSGTYAMGSTVKVLATPSAEYIFKEWTGGFTGSTNPANVIMDADKTVTAVFEKREYPLSLTIIGSGTVKEEIIKIASTATNYKSGTTVRLTPQPIEGFEFKGWSGDNTSSTSPLDVVISKATNLTCIFEKEETIKFSTNLDTGTYNVVDTLPLVITVSSKLPKAGILYSILVNWIDSSKQIFKLDTSLNASTLNLKIPGLKKAGNYSLSVTLTSKTSSTNILNKIIPIVNKPAIIFYSNNLLDSVSLINKTTSWYHTNKSFDQIFNVQKSLYWGFQQVGTGFVPFSVNQKADYWNDLGGYVYTDLTGDGKKDLWAYYWKNPWPTNAKGLHLFTEYEATPNIIDLQTGLTQVRKIVLADLDNDGKKEIVLFSSGYDANPFPGDSIGIFNITSKKYKYLSNDIGYFHGGATGDINNDGLIDIVAYSGGSAVIPIHPTAYINKGGGDMELSNSIFKNFTKSDNFYTVELFDINNDGSLDLLLGGQNKLKIVLNKSGQFDMSSAISVPIENGIELMDISFLDFDKDGRVDLLTMSNLANYKGYALRLYLQKSNGQFTEDSKSYFNVTQGSATNGWIKWIHLFDYDKDGDLDVVGDGIFGDVLGYNPNNLKVVYWRNDQGKFIQVIK